MKRLAKGLFQPKPVDGIAEAKQFAQSFLRLQGGWVRRKTSCRQKRGHNAVARRLTRVERLGHAAKVCLHSSGHRRCDSQGMANFLRTKTQEISRSRCGAQRANDRRAMPAADSAQAR